MNKHLALVLFAAIVRSAGALAAPSELEPAEASAGSPDADTMRAAERLAITTCGTCHGPRGNSRSSRFPKLAGQQEAYLAHALNEFKHQTRGDPDARAYMWGMAAQLDEDMIEALAKYFALQTPFQGTSSAPELVEKGKNIFEHGVAAENVLPCTSCHGGDAQGNGNFPRLAGQYGDYLVKQLKAFRNQLRKVAIMHAETKPLKVDEIEALASYLESK